MLQINGSIAVLPVAVGAEASQVRLGGEGNPPQPSVVLTFNSASGVVQVILPVEDIDAVIDNIQSAKKDAEKLPKSDLVVPDSMDSVEQFAKDLRKMNEEKQSET